jgi:hypothetical protein
VWSVCGLGLPVRWLAGTVKSRDVVYDVVV